MSDLSDYVEAIIRDWMSQGSDAPTPPTDIYVALHNGAPGDDGSTNEVSQSDYSRVHTNAGSEWDDVGGAKFDNAVEVNWGLVESDWGTISHVSIWDSETGGNCLGIMPLSSNITPALQSELYASPGDLTFVIDDTSGGGDDGGDDGGTTSGYGTNYGATYGA